MQERRRTGWDRIVAGQAGVRPETGCPQPPARKSALAVNPGGIGAAKLSEELYGTPDHVVAVRAETSRLRRHLVGVLLQRPYRFADWVDVHVSYPHQAELLLPASTAPTVRRLRAEQRPVP
jgi:hypothetical protein